VRPALDAAYQATPAAIIWHFQRIELIFPTDPAGDEKEHQHGPCRQLNQSIVSAAMW
jgi:hypothetical protein